MKQKTNHARSKRKRKNLLMQNFHKRVVDKRLQKLAKIKKPKGTTITGRAILHAVRPEAHFLTRLANRIQKLNQRQKRKLWRNAPHMRKRA